MTDMDTESLPNDSRHNQVQPGERIPFEVLYAPPAHYAEPEEYASSVYGLGPDKYVPSGYDEDPEGREDTDEFQALQNLEQRRAEKQRKKRIKIIVACAVLAVIALMLLLTRCLGSHKEEEAYVPETAVVERRDFESVISTSGALKAGSTVVVTPEVEGTIASVLVREGQTVKTGDLLFTIKNDQLDKAVSTAEKELQAAKDAVTSAERDATTAQEARDDAWNRYRKAYSEAKSAHDNWAYLSKNYNSLKAKYDQAKAKADACEVKQEPVEPAAPVEPAYPEDEAHKEDWDKYRAQLDEYQRQFSEYQQKYQKYLTYLDLLSQVPDEPQPAGTEPTFPDEPDDISLVAAIETAKDNVTAANRAVQKAQDAYDEAVETAKKREVKAPSGGNIVALGAKVGEAVGASAAASPDSSTVPLVQISDVNKMTVEAEVNEIDILSIKPGQPATATFSAVSGVECSAVVTEVNTIATNSGGEGGGIVTFHVKLVIGNPDPKLREGMTANVKIYTADIRDTLVVPASALSEGSSGTTVEVVLDERTFATETRIVEVLARSSTEAAIGNGLAEGQIVLLNGGTADGEDGSMG